MELIHQWRGFNVLDFIGRVPDIETSDFDIKVIADWGFNFIRLPLNYRYWTINNKVRDERLVKLDNLIQSITQNKLHVSLCLHTAPGYTVSKANIETSNLWKDATAQESFYQTWQFLCNRYEHIPDDLISFNPVNEPGIISGNMSEEDHNKVISGAIGVIREIKPRAKIILDGLNWGRNPLNAWSNDNSVIQSCRAYYSYNLEAHNKWEDALVSTNIIHSDTDWSVERMAGLYQNWLTLIDEKIPVCCNEIGCYKDIAHSTMLLWMDSILSMFKQKNIGWALWNFKGPFGIIDSKRNDVNYKKVGKYHLDIELLKLLQKY
jgi:endoglucanase